jgi:drug/metabolite transporter (DMT)-like permease
VVYYHLFFCVGAVIVFVGVFSVLFLNRKLVMREWGGIFLVIGGLALVGVSDFFTPPGSAQHTNVSAPSSNHSTGQIILGMFDMFRIERHGTVVSALFSVQDVPSSNFGPGGGFLCAVNLGIGLIQCTVCTYEI